MYLETGIMQQSRLELQNNDIIIKIQKLLNIVLVVLIIQKILFYL